MSFYKLAMLTTFILLVAGCYNGHRKGHSESVNLSLVNSEYKLKNVNKTEDSGDDFQLKLWQKGIDFYARGNEPFWALDMDFENGFYFKTLNGIDVNTPPVEGIYAADANALRFYIQTDSVTLIITILEEKCNDTMSDEVFPNKVKIEVKRSIDKEFQIYKGCGRYVADYGLHDIWVLTHLNGKDLQTSNSKEKRLPVFEFYASDGSVQGNSGCNNFHGTYYISGFEEIQFEEVSMTKKICKNTEIENLLRKSVFGRRMKYQREDLKLSLSGYDGSKFIFKKID